MKYTIRTSIILRQNTISVDNFSTINKIKVWKRLVWKKY